jgi:proteasome lid subunit RPN8/RPN11
VTTAKKLEKNGKNAFPGGSVDPEPGELRIAIEKKPYADIIGHAILEPDVEVCGVLVGSVLRDQRGDYLHITAAIRGEGAKQEGAQVTFTHETWNHIHGEMDKHHVGSEIVGWYHTHGGFGIFLSDMDAFIQRNFFSAPHQVAYVFDPLAGTEGFFQSRDGKLVLCRRHWVGGRERKSIPKEAAEAEAPDTGASRRGSTDLTAVTTALQKTAVALQAMAARPTESVPLFVWIAGGVLATAVGWPLLTGRPLISAQGDADSRRPGAMLILQRGSQGGPSVGIELREAWTHQGSVVRDEAGRLYVAAELRGPDGNPISLQGLLSQTASAAAPPPAPDVVDHPAEDGAKGRSLRVALAIAAAAIAAAGAAAWLWLRRKPVRRS